MSVENKENNKPKKNFLEKVLIEGFWGDKTVTLNFKDDVNFLIGSNGSGKTTIINLIAAALNADFPTLDRFQFSKITIHLKEIDGKEHPCIEVDKILKGHSPFASIAYKIKPKSTQAKTVQYSLEDEDRHTLWHKYSHTYEYTKTGRSISRSAQRDIHFALKELINLSWLSIHRATSRRQDERSFESTIDQKIEELSKEFLKYFSSLDKQASTETNQFQQHIFLSLLTDDSEENVNSFLQTLDADVEQQSLREIFMLFKLDENAFSKKLQGHFTSYKKSVTKFEAEHSIGFNELSVLLGTKRIHSVVQEWNKLLSKQKQIYKFRDTFLNVINSLLQKKVLQINEKNELLVKTQSEKTLSLHELSSGEKQLLIILGESLLQQVTPHIYIADEPELSLHVDWQEKIVSSLKSLNPNCQIIFATHSPDIVSQYTAATINVEKTVKTIKVKS